MGCAQNLIKKSKSGSNKEIITEKGTIVSSISKKSSNKEPSKQDSQKSVVSKAKPSSRMLSINELISVVKSREYGEICEVTSNGKHQYVNCICVCGKVCDIIEEDEEEYDEEGKCCQTSPTGNHHFRKGEIHCKYCGIMKSARMSIRKSVKKENKKDSLSLHNNPLYLENERRKSEKSFISLFDIKHQKKDDVEIIVEEPKVSSLIEPGNV